MFETTIRHTKEFYRKVYLAAFNKIAVYLFTALYILFSGFNLYEYIKHDDSFYLVLFLVLIVLTVLIPVLYFIVNPRRYSKIQAKRYLVHYNTEEPETVCAFEEDCLKTAVRSESDDPPEQSQPTRIKYEYIKKLVTGRKVYLLFISGNTFVAVNAEQLSETDKASLVGFLKSKGVKKIKKTRLL